MFTIDFTKPFLYKDVIYFNQGNLATNNILRCKLITGGDTTLEGYIATVAFKTLSHPEINASATIVDEANCIIDIKFPSNALEVGVNELEIVLNKGEGIDKVVTPSPVIKYEVWQCITTGNGIQGDNNYPILIDLIADVNNATAIANNAIDKANTSLNKANKMILDTNNVIVKANEVIDNTNNAKDKALEVIGEVEKAIAAGTQDLEVKRAREDSFGVTHDSLFQRLESDLKIDEKPLKQEILDLAGLKEIQEMTYDSTAVPNYNGSMVCEETKNGTVKDFKISGKSLINYCNSLVENFEISATLNSKICDFEFKAGKSYTLVVDFGVGGATSQENSDIFICQTSLAYENIKGVDAKGIIARRVIPKENVKGWLMGGRSGLIGKVTAKNFMILEGDHTQNTPQFFKGIASVGTGVDEMKISSCSKIDYVYSNSYGTRNDYTLSNALLPGCNIINKSNKLIVVQVYSSNTQRWIRDDNISSNKTYAIEEGEYCPIITLYTSKGWQLKEEELERIISISTQRQDEKPILFKDTDNTWKPIKELRGLNTVCDTVELHSDGKYYYHIRTEKRLYSMGDEDNLEVITDKTNTIAKLGEEKIFEVNPLFLEAYEGETMVSIDSGVVNAPIEFKIASYISNLVLLNQKRIKDLESEIYKSQDMQDMMILENDLRLMDIEFALMESMPIKLNLRSDDMFRGVTEFEFLKGRILSGSHTDEYLEKCINKYKKAGRLTEEEYDILYDMIYPPVYDVLAENK